MARDTQVPASQEPQQDRRYRPAKLLPTQLLDHVTVCLEEQLYTQAFGLLSNAVTSGQGSAGSSHLIPAHVPPLQHLTLAATLSVHPSLTTRTRDTDKHAAADEALTYLKNVHSVLGVKGANLEKAFHFVPKVQAKPRNKRSKTRHSDLYADDGDDDESTKIRSVFAAKDALWSNAEDFWSVVGWALNCSVKHKHRWDRWKVWLNFMLDVLASDLEAHVAGSSVAESMLAQYLSPIGEGRNNKRRLMRVILADGGMKDMAEFGEIWKNETKLPKPKKDDERAGKKRKLDLDNGEFGDYFDGDSDVDSAATSLPRSRSATAPLRASRQPSGEANAKEAGDTITSNPRGESPQPVGVEAFGGLDSITLRQRLLALLVQFCHLNPDPTTFLDTENLFDLYTEFLRPLSLPVFQALVLPPKRWLSFDEQSSLDQTLLRPLLASTAPVYDANALTQADFETHYAAFPANTTSTTDNARVSLLIEDLLRLLWTSGGLVASEGLRRCVHEGIDARTEKVAFDGRRKTGTKAREDEDAALIMECSGERMLACLEMIE